jgi:hypothetical protein
MELRIKKRTLAILTGLLFATPASFAQTEFQYEAWHGRPGALTISPSGVSFTEAHHFWHWDFQDIQQLKLSPKALTVLTYQEDKWKLGAGHQYEFDLRSDRTFEDAYPMLKSLLDQRFVAAMPTRPVQILWEIPVKHLLRFSGDEGVLRIGSAELVYSSDQEGASRTWRYEDIDNISSSGPFQLTITTFERAQAHYGNRKGFNFELKQPLDETRYNDLWLRLNQSKGLKLLSAYR